MVAKPSKEATEEIKERIRRILALTNNPNANEAAVAAEKAAQLLDEYGLSIHDVRKSTEQLVDEIYAAMTEHRYQHGTSTNDSSRQWKESLAGTVALHFRVHVHINKTIAHDANGDAIYTKSGYYKFTPHLVWAGEGMRVEAAVQVFEWIVTQMTVEAGKAWKGPEGPKATGRHVDPMRFRASFFSGANITIADRFLALRKDTVKDANTTALVTVGDKALKEYIRKNYNIGPGKARRSNGVDSAAFRSGREAGKRADIGQTGVGGGRRQLR
tara:strand:+ start:8870 stop:9682 length:813 start_codon:yes stop_codon:yes gene_type:complete